MKFPYIEIQPVINEALEDVRTLFKTSGFNDSDCYIWAIDVIREIGFNAYEPASTEIQIKKHTGYLPKNFYIAEEFWLCSPCHPDATKAECDAAKEPVKPSPHRPHLWLRTGILRPQDAESRRRSRFVEHQNCKYSGQTYQLKIPPGIIRTSVRDGWVSVDYLRLPEKDGQMLMQDEVNAIKCVKAYITVMLMRPQWLAQELRRDVWDDINGEYDTYLQLAQQVQKAFGSSDTSFKAIEQDQRYRNMRYIYQ